MDPNRLRKFVGQRIRALRQYRGLTQAELAESAHLSVEHVSRIERNVKAPSLSSIAAISEALEVQPRALFDFSDIIDQ
jgi:transcriptional regulator with XRE-family HTH domain